MEKRHVLICVMLVGLALLAVGAVAQEKGSLEPERHAAQRVFDPARFVRVFPSVPEGAKEPEVVPPKTRGEQIIKYEGFEGAWPNDWQIWVCPEGVDAYWGDENDGHIYEGYWSGYCADDGTQGVEPPGPYPDNMCAWLIYGPFDLSDALDAGVRFYHWTKTEHYFDTFFFGASLDGINFIGTEISGDWASECGGFCFEDFDLSDYTGAEQVWFAFVFESDYSIGYEGTYLDEIEIWKYVEECCDFSLNGWWFEQNGQQVPPNCLDLGQDGELHLLVENWCPQPIDVCEIRVDYIEPTSQGGGSASRKKLALPRVRQIPPNTTVEIVVPLSDEDWEDIFGFDCGTSYSIGLSVWPCCDETYPWDNSYANIITTCPCPSHDLALIDWWFEQGDTQIPPDSIDTSQAATLCVRVQNQGTSTEEITSWGISSSPVRKKTKSILGEIIDPGEERTLREAMLPDDLQFLFSESGAYHVCVEVWPQSTDDDPQDNTLCKEPINVGRPSWTFMVYLGADNNLGSGGYDFADFNELERAACNPNVNIVVQWDGPGYGDTRRYHVQCDTNPSTLADYTEGVNYWPLGELNMGEPNTLSDFINWATSHFPADHYALVLWNHGGGWWPRQLPPPPRGIVWDDTNGGDFLSTRELAQALSGTIHLDILGFDACLMQMIEVLFEVKDDASIVVGSEELEPGSGWDYDEILLNVAADTTPEALAQMMVSANQGDLYTISAFRCGSSISNVADKVSSFASILLSKYSDFCPQIHTARDQTQKFDFDNNGIDNHDEYIDLHHFADRIYANVNDDAVRNAAQALKASIEAARIAHWHDAQHSNAEGLSIYLPHEDAVPGWHSDYAPANLAFLGATQWDEFVQRFIQGCDTTCSITVISPNGGECWQPGSTHNITWTSQNCEGSVKIEYSTNGGANWTTIVASTPDDGSYSWTVPNTPSTHCLVRICCNSEPSCCDQSDGEFEIGGTCIATRAFEDACVDPQNPAELVTVTIVADQSYTGLALDEDPPAGWTIEPVDNGGATFNASEYQWLWLSVNQGERKQVTYRLVPNPSDPYGTYQVTGRVLSSLPPLDQAVCGDTDIEWAENCVHNCCIEYLVAHWVGSPTSGQVDDSDPCEIDLDQILTAIAWWADPSLAPANLTDVVCEGWPIDLNKILELIALWGTQACIDDCEGPWMGGGPQPKVGATATRSIDPDHVNPGDTFRVTVTIYVEENLTGLALDEDLVGYPGDWSPWLVTPVDNGGATYNPSEQQWLWLSASAGETKTVVYDVTVPSGIDCDGEYIIQGVVRSGLPEFSNPVSGEDTITCGAPGCWNQGSIVITAEGSGTDTATFGVDPEATDGFDLGLDVPQPPPGFPPYTYAYFTLAGDRYTIDLKAPIACGATKTWTLEVVDEGPADQVTLSWDPAELPVGNCNGTEAIVTLEDLTAGVRIDMKAQSTYTYTKTQDPETREFRITVACLECQEHCRDLSPAGWHMIALPGELCGECAGGGFGDLCCALCDDLDPCYIYHWDPETGYLMLPPCENIDYGAGMGIWVRTYVDPAQICADLEPAERPLEILLSDGWLQLGNPYDFPLSIQGLEVRCGDTTLSLEEAMAQGWVSAYLFTYDPVLGGYQMVTLPDGCIPPWAGFWFRSYVDGCTLIINPVECPPPIPSARALGVEELRDQGTELPPPPPSLPELAGQIQVVPVPNPVRDVHTTTFRVLGICPCSVQALKVEIYDLAGKLVWQGEVEGPMLAWHTENLEGLPLANGVYLYKAYVKINGEWIPAGVQKVAIFR